MKQITFFLFTCIALCITVSCSSDNPEPEDIKNKENYTFTFSIDVRDENGSNLLSKEPFESSGLYGKYNIFFNAEDDSQITYQIAPSSSDKNSLQLNVTVDTYGVMGTNTHTITVQWGNGYWPSTDQLRCVVEKNNEMAYCTKILINEKTIWDINDTAGQPAFSLVKPKNNHSHLPDANPITLSLAEKTTTDNAFAFDIFKATYKEATTNNEQNVFISPLSINYALNMLANGAVGETQKQIIETLRAKGYSIDQINAYSKELSEALGSVDPSTSFILANSIWHAPDFSIKDRFIQTNQQYYNAEVNDIDFSSPSDAISTINKWYAEKTKNKITNVLTNLSPETILILINTLYFKSGWAEYYKFNKIATAVNDFYAENGEVQKVNMMNQTNYFPYASNDYASFLSIPFGNKAYSMLFAIPNENKTIDDLIKNLDATTWIVPKTDVHIRLFLPRFKVESLYQLEQAILPSMGMTLPFSATADYSGIADSRHNINSILHKTFVEVNEDGAEAAATTIIQDVSSDGDTPPEPMNIHINQPFVFAIYENSTSAILFMGKIGQITE